MVGFVEYARVALLKKQLGLDASLYEILQILSVTVFEKPPVPQFFMVFIRKMRTTTFLTSCDCSANNRILVGGRSLSKFLIYSFLC